MTDLQAHEIPCGRCGGKGYHPDGNFPSGDCEVCDGGRNRTFGFSEPCSSECNEGLVPTALYPSCTDQPSWCPAGRVAVRCNCKEDDLEQEVGEIVVHPYCSCAVSVEPGYLTVTLTDEEAREWAGDILHEMAPLGFERLTTHELLAAAEMLKGNDG